MGEATPAQRNMKDSMKSTWRKADRKAWNTWDWNGISKYLIDYLDLHHTYQDKAIPVHQKTDPVPYVPNWQMSRWVLFWAFIPVALHQVYISVTGQNLGRISAFLFYSISLKLIAIHQLKMMRGLGLKYGFLDGDVHERDDLPDQSVGKILTSLLSTVYARPLMTVILAYNAATVPSTTNWLWLPFEIGLYGVVLDFWFYWYHRIMHATETFWKFHRTHHLTKHPCPLLTLYADTEQEIFDIVGVPFLTYVTMKFLGCPLGFYEWWICQQFVVFTELLGHSGLRIHVTPPSTFSGLLIWLGMDLTVEDHDLHHRKGWKKSHNYGKQTRVWDRLFGTCHDRIESKDGNIDYVNLVSMPLFQTA